MRGSCSSVSLVVLYSDKEQREASVEDLKNSLPPAEGQGFGALVGENWLVNSPQAPDLQGALGGKVVSLE